MRDPTGWFDDLSVYLDDQEVIEQAAALAGAFGGFTFSDEVGSSWTIFLLYLAVGLVVLRGLHPVSTWLLGPSVAWHASLAFFWSFMLATVGVLSARIETVWLAHTASIRRS